MSEARDAILNKIQGTQNSSQAAAARLARHPRGPQPHWHTDHLTRFCEKLRDAAGTFDLVPDERALPAAVGDYLHARQLGHTLTMAPHPLLEAAPWPADFSIHYGKADALAEVTVSVASCAIAETGSLMLLASPQTPTSLNFLADHFLCILRSGDIVPHMEDAWDRWRAQAAHVSRVINLITGPSRTADVEQIIQLGAHGPRHLHVLLIESDPDLS